MEKLFFFVGLKMPIALSLTPESSGFGRDCDDRGWLKVEVFQLQTSKPS